MGGVSTISEEREVGRGGLTQVWREVGGWPGDSLSLFWEGLARRDVAPALEEAE